MMNIMYYNVSFGQEFALKGSIEKFNSRYYQPDALPPSSASMATANGLMGGVGGVVASENQASAAATGCVEEEELAPLDMNYLSVLGKEVRYPPYILPAVLVTPNSSNTIIASNIQGGPNLAD